MKVWFSQRQKRGKDGRAEMRVMGQRQKETVDYLKHEESREVTVKKENKISS